MRDRGCLANILYDVAQYSQEKDIVAAGCWYRKGATGCPEAIKSQCYMDTGHPAIIPGNMGTGSYVVVVPCI